jgi:hypothetical protein
MSSTLRIVGKAAARTGVMSIAICIKRFSALVVSIIAMGIIAMVLGVVGPAWADMTGPDGNTWGHCSYFSSDGVNTDSAQCDDYSNYYTDGSLYTCGWIWEFSGQRWIGGGCWTWYP